MNQRQVDLTIRRLVACGAPKVSCQQPLLKYYSILHVCFGMFGYPEKNGRGSALRLLSIWCYWHPVSICGKMTHSLNHGVVCRGS